MCKGLATLPATCLKSAKDIKHKISFLLQKPEHQAADQKQMKEKTAAAAAAAKRVPTAAEVEKWKESFSHVMNSETGRTVFTSFLKSEFSEENIDFWLACEDYKKSTTSKLATRAKQIYQQYVEADSPNEVNLDAATREETRQNMENACPSCFNEAQKMIYILMEKDSYRRFLNSKLIQDLSQTHSDIAQMKKKKSNCDCTENRQALAGGA
ncbi:regulator of G-protein signaling 4-like isoform X2 [Thunnus maccoyii]|uniref:regulator of G-protein signaling 4-like isoform X2 n=1 Tax=Thunnus maccoyii TaxID=8240 RepID=UPI001C4BB681|nr:regulator of G-protein signaling 4-like isoform X2 [Thunnus maccoyii]